jgi:hypothetical protein
MRVLRQYRGVGGISIMAVLALMVGCTSSGDTGAKGDDASIGEVRQASCDDDCNQWAENRCVYVSSDLPRYNACYNVQQYDCSVGVCDDDTDTGDDNGDDNGDND